MNPALQTGDNGKTLFYGIIAVSFLFAVLSDNEPQATKSGTAKPVYTSQNKSQPKRVNLAGSEQFTKNSLAEIIHLGESRNRAHNDYNRGSERCRGSNRQNIHLVGMKIKTVMYYQSKRRCTNDRLFAVGTWQVIPDTMKLTVSSMGLSGETRFNSVTQNRIFAEYLTAKKRPAIASYIKGSGDLKEAGLHVALEWASMRSPLDRNFYSKRCKRGRCRVVLAVKCRVGKGCYDGHGSNVAHTSHTAVLSALKGARSKYRTLTGKGYPSKQAYALALGINNL